MLADSEYTLAMSLAARLKTLVWPTWKSQAVAKPSPSMTYDHAAQHELVKQLVLNPSAPNPAPTVVEEIPVSLTSILSTFGGDLEKVVLAPIDYITSLAKSAEPVVDKVFPGYANLYNSTVAAAVTIEAVFTAAGKQTGTGTQKLAYVVTNIEADFNAYWTGLGNTEPAALTTIEAWVNNVLGGIQMMQAPTTAPSTTAA